MFAISSVSAGYGTVGRRERAETNRLTEDRRIALQRGGPEAMREHRRTRRLRSVVLRVQQPAQDRLETHDVEVVAVDHAGAHLARLAEADHREADGRERPDALQRFHALLKVLDFRHGERGVLDDPDAVPAPGRPQRAGAPPGHG